MPSSDSKDINRVQDYCRATFGVCLTRAPSIGTFLRVRAGPAGADRTRGRAGS